ncbi:ankyrin repeat domain-containing protein 54-like [Chelonus insularis]|uniref:ankyrin repeat domain-containing protein 54-like n=1 Tax=Chelonus insularis TaxID=460826 RepID=UPI00158D3D88|nr:ankyrin repeat domain-containing protein 54-like [Chelonus insularis]
MASANSGVETGKDSNDSAQLENPSHRSLKNVSTADSNSSELRFNIPSNFKLEYFPNTLERLDFFKKAVREEVSLRQNKIKSRSLRKKNNSSYHNFMLERRIRRTVIADKFDSMKEVLEKGMSPNINDDLTRTSLHSAACRSHTDIAKLLLDHGANPNVVDLNSNTPLHSAAVNCKYDMVTLILETGSNVLTANNPLPLAESKLKFLRSCRETDMKMMKEEIHKIINMLVTHLKKKDNTNEQIEELSSFCSRISLSNTQDQVQDDLNSLLASINALSLTT